MFKIIWTGRFFSSLPFLVTADLVQGEISAGSYDVSLPRVSLRPGKAMICLDVWVHSQSR